MEVLYPEIDPWIPSGRKNPDHPQPMGPPPDQEIWHSHQCCRNALVLFLKTIGLVRSYPIGIGDLGWFSPLGTFHITEKRLKPTWYIPQSLQEKFQMKIMPPGPENPLGDHSMGLSIPGYGIHGTNFRWAIERMVTHGCIRLYPEDMDRLFPLVPTKTPVEFIYEPVKIGFQLGRIFTEVHPDIYGKFADLVAYGLKKVENEKWADRIDREVFTKALQAPRGLPIDITKN